jgi:hypothetical protein
MSNFVWEADDNALDDVQVDLPKIGKRLRSFTLTATRSDSSFMSQQVLKVRLAKEECLVEAANPDLETRGIISDIETVADRCRRAPRWLTRFLLISVLSIDSESGPVAAIVMLTLALLGFSYSVAGGLAVLSHFTTPKEPGIPWPASIISGIVTFIVAACIVTAQIRMRTLLFTGTPRGCPYPVAGVQGARLYCRRERRSLLCARATDPLI